MDHRKQKHKGHMNGEWLNMVGGESVLRVRAEKKGCRLIMWYGYWGVPLGVIEV